MTATVPISQKRISHTHACTINFQREVGWGKVLIVSKSVPVITFISLYYGITPPPFKRRKRRRMGKPANRTSITSEAIAIIVLGGITYLLLVGYLIVLLNTIHTNQGLKPSDIGYWSNIPSSSKVQDRWHIDYAIQFIAFTLALAVPITSILTLYIIQVAKSRFVFVYLGLTLITSFVWAAKVVVWEIIIMLTACTSWGPCVREDGDTTSFSPSNTFTWRLVSGTLITLVMILYLFLAKPLSDMENQELVIDKRQ